MEGMIQVRASQQKTGFDFLSTFVEWQKTFEKIEKFLNNTNKSRPPYRQ
jgi:hypothetical protein